MRTDPALPSTPALDVLPPLWRPTARTVSLLAELLTQIAAAHSQAREPAEAEGKGVRA